MTSNEPTEAIKKPPVRPFVITALCVLFFIFLCVALIAVLVNPENAIRTLEPYGVWYTAFLLTSTICTAVAFIGFWKMKRWGLYVYVAMFLIGIVVSYAALGWVTVGGLLAPIALIAVVAFYFRRMT